MRYAIILTLLWPLIFPSVCLACCVPDVHPGLWNAIEEAQAIAIVRVDAVHPDDTYSPSKLYHDGYRAGLDVASGLGAEWLHSAVRSLPEPEWTPRYQSKVHVLDVLKGSMAAGETAYIHSTFHCKEGGYFVPGRTLMVFLHQRRGGWHPLPWNHSTTYFEKASGIIEMARVVLRGADLQAKGPVTSADRHAWAREALRTASSRRWLGRDLDLLSNHEIAKAFVEVPTVDEFNLNLLERLTRFENSEVDRQAMRILEAWLTDSRTDDFFSSQILILIESRLGHPMEETSVDELWINGQAPQRWKILQKQLGIVDLDASQTIAERASFSAWRRALYDDAQATYY